MSINMKELLNKESYIEPSKSSNEIRIIIAKPREEVFEFVLEPGNKSSWCSSIENESVDTEQIGLGTRYKNNFGELEVTDYECNVYFELSEIGTKYQCSYSFHKIDDEATEIVYFEGMLDGSELDEMMESENFEHLKKILES